MPNRLYGPHVGESRAREARYAIRFNAEEAQLLGAAAAADPDRPRWAGKQQSSVAAFIRRTALARARALQVNGSRSEDLGTAAKVAAAPTAAKKARAKTAAVRSSGR